MRSELPALPQSLTSDSAGVAYAASKRLWAASLLKDAALMLQTKTKCAKCVDHLNTCCKMNIYYHLVANIGFDTASQFKI